jgi:hypothetical protein
MFIACSDKKVYCYTLTGKTDKNWKFETTNHFVFQPVQYINYDNKDYIYFVDSLNVYIVGKDGRLLIDVKTHFLRIEMPCSILNLKTRKQMLAF